MYVGSVRQGGGQGFRNRSAPFEPGRTCPDGAVTEEKHQVRAFAKAASAGSSTRGNGSTSSFGILAAMLACAAAFLGIGAPAASAAPEATTAYRYLTSFGAGQVDDGSSFVGAYPANALAVDPLTRNILLADDFFKEKVVIFSPDANEGGSFLTEFSPGQFKGNIATDAQSGAVYIQDAGPGSHQIERFLSDGQATPSYTLDPTFTQNPPGGIGFAIDPTTHDILVFAAATNFVSVERLAPNGDLLSTFSVPGTEELRRAITVGLDGTIYIGGARRSSRILRFEPDGTRLSDLILGPDPASGKVGYVVEALAVDPATGNLTALATTDEKEDGTSRIVQFSPSGAKLFDIPAEPGDTKGIAIDGSNGRLYVFNRQSVAIDTYVPAPFPGIDAPTASDLGATSVHLSTEVDPGEELGGGNVPAGSGVRFEYRLVGTSEWKQTPDQVVVAPGTYAGDVEGLVPNLSYELRAVAFNDFVRNPSDPVTVTTEPVAPEVSTSGATDVKETSAVLNGSINPIGLPTTYHFEYGTTTAYGSRIPVGIEAVAGAGHAPKRFSRGITGLAPNTTYHFRLVASNSSGTTEGNDRTFTTAGIGGVLHRAYEQVTPAAKEGAALYRRIGFQASPDGNAFSYVTQIGSESAPLFARSISERGSSDWRGGINVDPPTNGAGPLVRDHLTLALSDDFSHAFVVSNRALTPEAIEGNTNLYNEDISTGTYSFVGASDDPGAFSLITGIQTSGLFLGGSSDFSWMVFAAPVSLMSGVPANAIYRWSRTSGLEVESVLPNGEPSAGVRGLGVGSYDAVSPDGSRIYYTTVNSAENGVYLDEAGEPLKAISVSRVPGDPPGPRPGTLVGINRDGGYAFFVSTERLTEDAPKSETLGFGESSIYRYDVSDDNLEFLGTGIFSRDTLLGVKSVQGSYGIGADGRTFYFEGAKQHEDAGTLYVWRDGVIRDTSMVVLLGFEHPSPNGRYFAFNADGSHAVYLYDAETNETSCASCLADGTPMAATLPWGQDSPLGNRRPLAVDDSGTVYFDTPARLVASDANGVDDVYSYRDGVATLISPGNAPYSAFIADVTPDGRNVFFTTGQKLVGRDDDEEVDVYDARVDGGLPAQSPPPPHECLRDDCKATPNAGPELPFGGSEALNGPENVKPKQQKKCGKGKRPKKIKGKVRCVKKHKPGQKHKANKTKKGASR